MKDSQNKIDIEVLKTTINTAVEQIEILHSRTSAARHDVENLRDRMIALETIEKTKRAESLLLKPANGNGFKDKVLLGILIFLMNLLSGLLLLNLSKLWK